MRNVINPWKQIKDGSHFSTESGSQMNREDVCRPSHLFDSSAAVK